MNHDQAMCGNPTLFHRVKSIEKTTGKRQELTKTSD